MKASDNSPNHMLELIERVLLEVAVERHPTLLTARQLTTEMEPTPAGRHAVVLLTR